jgi:hypothetical protein
MTQAKSNVDGEPSIFKWLFRFQDHPDKKDSLTVRQLMQVLSRCSHKFYSWYNERIFDFEVLLISVTNSVLG